LKIVENVESQLSVKELAVEDLTDVRTIALDNQVAYHIEIPLIDDKNDNSCNLTYYEVGPIKDNLKMRMTNMIVMQFLNEPYFNDLRTK
jgi:hypothetical protein